MGVSKTIQFLFFIAKIKSKTLLRIRQPVRFCLYRDQRPLVPKRCFYQSFLILVPTAHWVGLNDGGFANPLVSAMLPRIIVMYTIVGFAFFFYVTKFPERLLPGLVDIVGHSHQWWHLLIFLALYFWHKTGVTWSVFRLTHGCAAQGITDETRNELVMWPFE